MVNVLENFTKDKFDLGNARSIAVDLKHREDIKQILKAQLKTPTEDFVRFFHEAIKSQMEIQDFTDVVKRAFHEFLTEHNEEKFDDGDEQDEEEPNDDGKSLLKLTNLRVTMPDGNVIYHHNGKETYIEVLEKLGLEEVMRVRPNIVSTEQFSLATKGIKRGRFWVRGTDGFSTRDRKVELEKIADLLGVSLRVEQVEKEPKSGRDTRRAENQELSEADKSHLRYWTGLREYMQDKSSRLNCHAPSPSRYIVFSIGRSGFSMETHLAPTSNEISIRLCIDYGNVEAYFYLLQEQQAAIEKAFGGALEWNELPGKKRSRISLTKVDTDPLDENDWPRQYEWFTTQLEVVDTVFRERIRGLDAADWRPEADDP